MKTNSTETTNGAKVSLVLRDIRVTVGATDPNAPLAGTYDILCNGTVLRYQGLDNAGNPVEIHYKNDTFPELDSIRQLWTPSYPETPVVISADNARHVSHVFPAHIAAGSDFVAETTFRNLGGTTWTRAEGYNARLFAFGPPIIIQMRPGDQAEPGNPYTFRGTLTAPLIPGVYQTTWIVRKGATFFGIPSDQIPVIVVPAANNANLGLPAAVSVASGSSASSFTATVNNLGSATWTGPSYALQVTDDIGNITLIAVPSPVATGAAITFTIPVSRPNLDPVVRRYRLRMTHGATKYGAHGEVPVTFN
jgi:hypothetical protein